jgi:Rrf2 family protein
MTSVKLSTRSRYGLRALYELAQHYGQGPLETQIIADRQAVSRKYLDAILSGMKNAGLVRSRRGAGGGHELARDPTQITVGDVIRSLEGTPLLLECVGDATTCRRAKGCVARDVWTEVEQTIHHTLDGISIADLVARQSNCARAARAKR